MTTLKAVRGTRDLLPPEIFVWQRIEATARRVFARYNFGEIRTPIFEDTGLFARGVGEETDIVSKEMYTWEDRERFGKNRLKDAYLRTWGREQISLESNVQIGGTQVDLIFRRWGVRNEQKIIVVEIVEFSQDVSANEIQRMTRLLGSFRGASEDESVLGMIVIPQKRNSPLNVSGIQEAAKAAGLEFKSGGFGNIHLTPRESDHSETENLREMATIIIHQTPGDFFQSSQSLTLRPENTAGVVRAYIEHKLGETGQLQKLYYIGPQFRRERPQKGRYRQFSQIGAEVIGPPSAGSESPLRDAEVLEMLATLLDELGISGWTLEINSVGSSADRARYNEVLREALIPVAPQMCVDCQRRAVTNPLRVLDCKVPEDQPIIDALPKIVDSLDQESKTHFAAVLAALDAAQVPYTRNHRLVRGLDYYTRTTFEFTHGGLGAQNALLGGGRYDGLSEAIGGPKAPGIGFAMGEDRLVLTIQAQEKLASPQVAQVVDAFIAPLGDAKDEEALTRINAAALALARELRRAGLSVELGDGTFRLKKSFETADKVARRIVIMGEDELASGILTVKTFSTGVQTKVPRAELAHLLAQPA